MNISVFGTGEVGSTVASKLKLSVTMWSSARASPAATVTASPS